MASGPADAQPPRRTELTAADAVDIAVTHFGLRGVASPLPGEIDQNFLIKSDEGAFVLKVSPPEVAASLLAARQFGMSRLAAAGLPYRFTESPPGREAIVPLPSGGSATLLTWVDGTPFAEAGRPAAAARDIGRLAGSVVRALEGFDHPALHHDGVWNLAAAPGVLRDLVDRVASRTDRQLIEDVRDQLMVHAPKLQQLPKQVIHGDINDLNVLLENGAVAGLIDFGDLVYSWRVGEVAIAAGYVMLGKDDPLAAAEEVVAGFSEVVDVTELEASVIYDLIRVRLAISACVAAARSGGGNPHHAVSEEAVWDLLDRLDFVDAVAAGARLSRAAGFEPVEVPGTLLERRRRVLGPNLSLAYESSPAGPLHIVRGAWAHLYDAFGRRYLDCVNNVAHVGHSHPDVVNAAVDQMMMLNTNTRYLHDNAVGYAERLLATLPDRFEVVYLVNSGSEANELALRLARTATGRRAMAVLDHGYHGNTSAMVELSPYKFNGPGGGGRPDWVTVLPLRDPYRPDPDLTDYAGITDWLLDEREPVAGVIAESIVGCGGQVKPDAGDLAAVYERVRRRGGVCIADEVQTGLGRVGSRFWAFELDGLDPDIVTMGKPLGNGHPLGAVATTREIAETFANGMEYFNTFGGNPVSAAIGLAVLDAIEEDDLQAHAQEVGSYLLAQLRSLMQHHDSIGDVRGWGLFVGIELVTDRADKAPDAPTARRVVDHAREHGVLLSIDGPNHNVIKIKPPMVFSASNADRLAEALDEAL